ncbi:IlvD/Edd family dehydratase [Agromyces archimandritae]|uniref:Dihydroxy-acid dehydratase n=1 Tax=Agromyces archimandritae TaxID=2781962 RepID=A0A975FR19_9MICO|nr:IlvD/Edd family dehydratase [Agromyces archimandritae]QTX05656.1 dihydroxy-acid dehydratase [Agromyces archimandritae]
MSDEERERHRSSDWFEGEGVNGFIHRSWMKNQGHPDRMFNGRPVIGICQTFSDLTPCNGHFREIAEFVKRGVYEAGGLPVEFPVMSLGETIVRPTTMLYRNLVSMDVEESIRANPLDGVVLLCGCDKTTPALLMGAASVDLPTIVVSGGPMLTGRMRGRPLGSGTDVFRLSEEVRAGSMSVAEFRRSESCMSRSAGHCNTMGTASTMASIVESLGLGLPGNAALPAVDSRRRVLAHDSGRRVVELVREGVRMSDIVTRQAIENAVIVNAALAGSTNAIVHLLALAGRLDIPLELAELDHIAAGIPAIVDVQPSGRFLMEDFFEAGGIPAVMQVLRDALHGDALTVVGTVRERAALAERWDDEVVRDLDRPVVPAPTLAVLHGNLAPDGAVIKASAASPELLVHTGPAVVFESMDDLERRYVTGDGITVDSVLVLRGAGPRGYPGMPELGNLPLPPHLLRQGVRDMVRISDARMSGTAFGTVVLHVAPEAAVGGPLGLVREGDLIALDVPARRLELLVDAEELERRRATATSAEIEDGGGYAALYRAHVTQADTGADFDFLRGRRGSEVHGDNH